jgi:type III restriction enzyme
MAHQLQLKFDPNQQYQLDAVESVVSLFEGLPKHTAAFQLGNEIIPNLPPYETLMENWLFENLRKVQIINSVGLDQLPLQLEVEDGMVLPGVGHDSWRYPSFTIEMETGTGKTYVYLRTIYELREKYGFSKFVVVVPSIAIYEGVIKNFQITQSHFRALYSNETVNLVQYDGSRLSQLRGFATSTFTEVLVITLDSFNKLSNVIFKPSEKLPGERLPIEYIQETRPILILDEPQNMGSTLAKAALRTLHPLFALRYSATHRESPNLVYRLTPFEAFRQNLVKKIQVFGVTERDNFNQPFLALQEVKVAGRGRDGIHARMKTYIEDKGRVKEADITLKHGEDLYAKTGRDEHQGGYKVVEINARDQFIEFENGIHIVARETIGPSRPEIFRVQIRKTIDQHMQMQQKLERRGIKVLSLFFIDRVANYTDEDGIIRRIFDEEYERLKHRYPFYTQWSAQEVRSSYFAKKKAKKGEDQDQAIDTDSRNKVEREAEKAAFELIMKDKERLLSFYDGSDELKKTCFVFAHSALKEGWDNPNVFQICTLNQTVSEIKKRQEIGRGLRLAVDQNGERVFSEDVNVLSVIANESYRSYAANLQREYRESGDAPPPLPRDAYKLPAKRNEAVFARQAFHDFWAKLQRRTNYQIQIDTPKLIDECIGRINNQRTPQAVIVVERGSYVVTEYSMRLERVEESTAHIRVIRRDTDGTEITYSKKYKEKAGLAESLGDERLRDFKIKRIADQGDNSYVVFGNELQLSPNQEITFQSEEGQKVSERAVVAPTASFPVPNLIDRAAKETGLTRPTINKIFKGLSDRKKQSIFANPEGFCSQFITEVNNALADHVAERIEFTIDTHDMDWGYDLEDLFPRQKEFPQRELVEAGPAGLYDQVQVDSDVEKRFVEHRMLKDDKLIFYFKFPPTFRIPLPKIIGSYNPDWGIARYTEDDKIILELVRETKGGEELERLQFPHEKRKIICAKKHFKRIEIDYRVVSDAVVDWWKSEEQERMDLS